MSVPTQVGLFLLMEVDMTGRKNARLSADTLGFKSNQRVVVCGNLGLLGPEKILLVGQEGTVKEVNAFTNSIRVELNRGVYELPPDGLKRVK